MRIADVGDAPLYPYKCREQFRKEYEIEMVFPPAWRWQHMTSLSADLFSLIKSDERLSPPGHAASPPSAVISALPS